VSRRGLRPAIIAVVMVVAVAGGIVALYRHFRPYFQGTGCEARSTAGFMPLDSEQAANAATIAVVALRRRLPERATVVAYATALQESHMRNLESGDRDSVGLFQQRPSQGWGTARRLRDPAYATGRFFDALVKVKGYRHIAVHVAAQRVQHSADGSAYEQHEWDARVLAAAYTGRVPGAVRCWYPPDKRQAAPDPKRALEHLRTTLSLLSGSEPETREDLQPSEPPTGIAVPDSRSGWTMAAWMVANARRYGLAEVRYSGRHWRASSGHDGWTTDRKAPADRILVT
jgi:hypothetical protein